MIDDASRLIRLPRLCRCCAKECVGLRCRHCWSLVGRIERILKGSPNGETEEKIGRVIFLESELRRLESEGSVHETPKGWSKGRHPEQVALSTAFAQRNHKEQA